MVTGSGTVYGRPVFAFSQDFTGTGTLVLPVAVVGGHCCLSTGRQLV